MFNAEVGLQKVGLICMCKQIVARYWIRSCLLQFKQKIDHPTRVNASTDHEKVAYGLRPLTRTMCKCRPARHSVFFYILAHLSVSAETQKYF